MISMKAESCLSFIGKQEKKSTVLQRTCSIGSWKHSLEHMKAISGIRRSIRIRSGLTESIWLSRSMQCMKNTSERVTTAISSIRSKTCINACTRKTRDCISMGMMRRKKLSGLILKQAVRRTSGSDRSAGSWLLWQTLQRSCRMVNRKTSSSRSLNS